MEELASAERAVEVFASGYGSGYRIGGRLVVTCAHILRENDPICEVRVSSGRFDADVLWLSHHMDVAVLQLRADAAVGEVTPVRLGRLPPVRDVRAHVEFDMYGYPSWAATKLQGGGFAAGRRHVMGWIRLGDTSPEGLVVLDAFRTPGTKAMGSAWVGMSGAAVLCRGVLVAIQRHHQNPDVPGALEATPVARVAVNDRWRSLLELHGISPMLVEVGDVPGEAHNLSEATHGASTRTSVSVAGDRSSVDDLVAAITSGDPLAARTITPLALERPGLLPALVRSSTSTEVGRREVQRVLESFPKQSSEFLVPLVRQARTNWHSAAKAAVYFGPLHGPYCEAQLLEMIDRSTGDIDVCRLAIEALGRCGDTDTRFVISELLDADDTYTYAKLASYVLEALARLFVRSAWVSSSFMRSNDITACLSDFLSCLADVMTVHPSGCSHFNIRQILLDCDGRHADALIRVGLTAEHAPSVVVAANALGDSSIRRAAPALMDLLATSAEPDVLRACSVALAKTGSERGLMRILAVPTGSLQAHGLPFGLRSIQDQDHFRAAVRQVLGFQQGWAASLAYSAIGERGDDALTEVVVEGLDSRVPVDRGVAALTLARLHANRYEHELHNRLEQAADACESAFSALAVLLIEPTVYDELEQQLRRDLSEVAYDLHTDLQRDILSALNDIGVGRSIELAKAWQPYFRAVRRPDRA